MERSKEIKKAADAKASDAKAAENKADERKAKITRGGWNLIIMVAVTILISLALTVISLAVYHYSGDIYLDRSRPGYLPDNEEVGEEDETEEGEYSFGKTGVITKEILNEYLEKLQVEVKALNDYQEPFGDSALSDEHFGL